MRKVENFLRKELHKTRGYGVNANNGAIPYYYVHELVDLNDVLSGNTKTNSIVISSVENKDLNRIFRNDLPRWEAIKRITAVHSVLSNKYPDYDFTTGQDPIKGVSTIYSYDFIKHEFGKRGTIEIKYLTNPEPGSDFVFNVMSYKHYNSTEAIPTPMNSKILNIIEDIRNVVQNPSLLEDKVVVLKASKHLNTPTGFPDYIYLIHR